MLPTRLISAETVSPTAMPMRPPRPGQRERLDQELGEDVAAPGADRLADADLAGPLADRDQHDVHDPDAADDQRDRGDAPEQQRQRAADRVGRLEQLRLVEDREVVVVGRREAVARPQERRDLGLDRRHLRLVGDADADRPDVVARDEVLADDADRHHDLVVGVLEAGTALGLEDADQPERQAADGDLAADRAGVELEVVGGRGARAPRPAGPARPRCRSGTSPATRRRPGRRRSRRSCR